MVKDWLSAKYNIKIEDTENLSLYVCICIMIFIIIFDSATYGTPNNLGSMTCWDNSIKTIKFLFL